MLLSFLFFITHNLLSQNYTRVDSIKVQVNGNWLKNPWAGGHNYIQLSDIDMNGDGIKDLFVFDRAGHRVTTYINKGTPNTVDYIDSTFKYASHFPHLEDWVLLRDYNCDGKPDIFTYAISVGGVKVWRNTSTPGNLQFTLESNYIKSDYTPTITTDPLSNLYITRVDIPTIDDIDGDGDLDILTFDFSGSIVEYHINKSKELGYNCDSLIFILDVNGCWGDFQEDPNNCDISLSACRTINYDTLNIINHLKENLHTGSCSVCLDIDADGDKDILIGDISCCSMSLLTNGGTTTAATVTSKDITFPSGNIPVNMSLFPCGYFLDVDNDNKRDLIVAPNAPNVSVDVKSIWFYKNIGADNAPIFTRVKRNLLQDEMIDVGQGADPVFFDFDSDGLIDLLVSNYIMFKDSCTTTNDYGVYAFKNIGTATNPRFNLIDTNFANLSVQLLNLPSKHLTFGDLDGDGDQDMMVGDYDGYISYFTNTAGAGNPCVFTLTNQNYLDDGGTPIDIGSYATPQLIDVDRDGDLDLIIGERAGNLNYYENIGTTTLPSFSQTTSNFGGVDVMKPCCSGYSTPFMYDSLGKYNLLVGSEANRNYKETGWIWKYKGIDATLSGNFTLVDSMFQNIWEGQRMMIHGADITADGSMDLVIGNYAGGVAIYLGDSNTVPVNEYTHNTADFIIYPNPSSTITTIAITNFKQQENYSLSIYNMQGKRIFNQSLIKSKTDLENNLPSGIYLIELRSTETTKMNKLIILK